MTSPVVLETRSLLKRFGVHMKDAADMVLGITASVHAVFKDNDDPTKPTLRVPPKRSKWSFWG